MKKTLHLLILLFPLYGISQNNNGTLDMIEELSTKITVPIPMNDGTQLMTDVFIPVTSDSMRVNATIFGTNISLELIPKGTQLVQYPTLTTATGQIPNPKPYQMPLVFTRTPYNKNGDIVGRILAILGYSYALQDMRGRYASQGIYFPMHSDSWKKTPYHPNVSHLLDPFPASHISNANRHEDGWDSYQYLLNQLSIGMDLDNDGDVDIYDNICNGSMGMFGASALGNTQLQLASAHKINPTGPGMKCLFPIVATNEHYGSTGFNNGVFREGLVRGWVFGQFWSGIDNTDYLIDNSPNNTLHTTRDYNLPTIVELLTGGVSHFTEHQYDGQTASYYPNGIMRCDMDASFAPVDAQGEGDPNGTHSRYENINVPVYHLSGWYDIFVNGQIDTWKKIRTHADPIVRDRQKIVIGPWAHQTIGGTTTGDVTYKTNVKDIIGIAVDDIDLNNIPIGDVANSELVSWFRSQLNYNDYKNIGEPTYRIPESQNWQNIAGVGEVRVPSQDYDLTLPQLLGFLTGASGLPNIPTEVRLLGFIIQPISLPIPALPNPILNTNGQTISGLRQVDFSTVPDCRFYVIGPVNDNVSGNENVGNYWKATQDFPFTQGINWQNFYLHQNGTVDLQAPAMDEGIQTLIANPNNPVYSIGGCNMAEKTPQRDRESQGQMNLADSRYDSYALNNPGVLQFATQEFADSMSFIGFPKATFYAKSMPNGANPGDPTDTDFFVRITDEYPDGRVLFVCEGAVNARAREYSRAIYNGQEDIHAPFSNINSDQIYEYQMEMLPIAYTFGRGHKMRVLISSGNHPRYQANPNVPIEQGDFYRRTPSDNSSYNYMGQIYQARIANNSVAFSNAYPSRLELPLFNSTPRFIPVSVSQVSEVNTVKIYPNPATNQATIEMSMPGDYRLTLYNTLGQPVKQQIFGQNLSIDITNIPSGMYVAEIWDERNQIVTKEKLVVQK
jgi:predicted acyl esterase